MGETSNQIERHIQDKRNDLSDNFSELSEKVRTAVDWRAQFEERPGTMMALAFGGGVLLSALLPHVRSSRKRPYDARREAPATRSAQAPSTDTPTAVGGESSQASETWEAVKGALLGVAATKLSGFVEELIPGFQQEFAKSSVRTGPSVAARQSWEKSTVREAN
jgi:hypothetical protein